MKGDNPIDSSVVRKLIASMVIALGDAVREPFVPVILFLPEDNPVEQLLEGQRFVFRVTIQKLKQ